MTEPYLTTEQLAARWGLKPSTIKSQRSRGNGPPHYELPRIATPAGEKRVRYALSAVLAFEQTHGIIPLNP
jgi:hypothetical protein